MKIRTKLALTIAAITVVGACANGPDSPLVARAADHELTVDDAARLLGGVTEIPNQADVVRALADLWTDYTLLAVAVTEDTTLQNLDMELIMRPQLEQEMVIALRDSLIRPDTTVSEDELRSLFETDAPGARVRARHILLSWPQGATDAQRDSVRQRMQAVIARLEAGESFAAVAEEVSEDPGSASNGGDLGFFERGTMVAPFEEAAFALQAGETSGIVESPFGLHVIKVEERETPTFEDVRDGFRQQVQDERFQRAESTYIAGLEERAAWSVPEGTADLVREIAANPRARLGTRAGRRALVTYEGGEFTVAELQAFLSTRQPQFMQGLSSAPDEAIEENFLRGLVQRELLVAEARAEGLEPSEARADSLAADVRRNIREIARQAGLMAIERQGTESMEQAIDRVIEQKLRGVLQGTESILPLGAISPVLRGAFDNQFFPGGADQAVAQIAEVRGTGGGAPAAPSTEAPVPAPAPDSAGG